MATITDQLSHLNTAKGLIRDAIIDKGVAVPETTPFRQYADKIAAIGGGATDGWTRPSDRPEVPTVNKNEIHMLFAVMETGLNDYAVSVTATGGYYAEWGDGSKDTLASGVTAQHLFDYASLSQPVSANGIKWVWMKFYPVNAGANITAISLVARPSWCAATFTPNVVEIYLRCPAITGFGSFTNTSIAVLRQLQVFHALGENNITSFSYFLRDCVKLQSLKIDTSKGTNFSDFLYGCASFNQALSIDTSKGTDFSYFLYNCPSFNQPLSIDTSKGTSFNRFLYGCYSFNQPLNIDTSSGVDLSSFLSYGYSFNQPLNIDTSRATNINSFLLNCYSLAFSLVIDLASATSAEAFSSTTLNLLTGLRLRNMRSNHNSVTIQNSNLTADALAALFGDLYDRAGLTAGTITITYSLGAASLSAQQRAIATNKNWTIVG